jgi:hypothetical protein
VFWGAGEIAAVRFLPEDAGSRGGLSPSVIEERPMSFNPRYVPVVLMLAGLMVSTFIAPSACADGADATIADLQAQGYTVQINYLNGASEDLPFCTVVNVNDPDSTPQPPASTTLFVDVACPNHHD